MKDRREKMAGGKATLTVVSRRELSALRGCLAENRDLWLLAAALGRFSETADANAKAA